MLTPVDLLANPGPPQAPQNYPAHNEDKDSKEQCQYAQRPGVCNPNLDASVYYPLAMGPPGMNYNHNLDAHQPLDVYV